MPKYIINSKRHMQQPDKNNVISLNRTLNSTDIVNVEQAIELATRIRTDLADDITDLVMENILGMLGSYGILTDNSRTNPKDLILVEQAIKSALHRYYGIEHPLQEIAEDVFEVMDDKEESE